MRGRKQTRHPLPPSPNRGPEYWRRRGQRVKRVKLCGSCKGRGQPRQPATRQRASFRFWIYRWEQGEYQEVAFYPLRMACGTCGGSGLNCSQQRALELEQANA